MAWTHLIEGRTDMFNIQRDSVVVIDRSIYVIGYNPAHRGELQVHILHVDRSRWTVVRRADERSVVPKMLNYFAVAQNDDIFVFGGELNGVHKLYIFNTKNMKWSFIAAFEDVFFNRMAWWGAGIRAGKLYILAEFASMQMWALHLETMTWVMVKDFDLEDNFNPERLVMCGNRIYIFVSSRRDLNIRILQYDISTRRMEWMDTPDVLPFRKPVWTSFLYLDRFYYICNYRADERQFVFKYFLERNEREKVRFEGVQPLFDDYSAGNVVVMDTKAFFFQYDKSDIHVLDLEPTLKTRCLSAVWKYELDSSCLPDALRTELKKYRLSESQEDSAF